MSEQTVTLDELLELLRELIQASAAFEVENRMQHDNNGKTIGQVVTFTIQHKEAELDGQD